MGNTVSLADQNKPFKVSLGTKEKVPEPSQVDWNNIWKPLSVITGLFLVFFFLPPGENRQNQPACGVRSTA